MPVESRAPQASAAAPAPAPPAGDPPLEREWTVYLTQPPPQAGRGAPAKKANPEACGEFSTVRAMWGYLNNIPEPGDFPVNSDLSIFQRGVEPVWDCEANANGGRWTYLLHGVGPSKDFGRANACWLELVLLLAGEQLDPAFHVAGVSIGKRSNRSGDYMRISIWTFDRSNDAANLAIGAIAHATSPSAKLEYQDHRAGYSDYRHVLEPLEPSAQA